MLDSLYTASSSVFYLTASRPVLLYQLFLGFQINVLSLTTSQIFSCFRVDVLLAITFVNNLLLIFFISLNMIICAWKYSLRTINQTEMPIKTIFCFTFWDPKLCSQVQLKTHYFKSDTFSLSAIFVSSFIEKCWVSSFATMTMFWTFSAFCSHSTI